MSLRLRQAARAVLAAAELYDVNEEGTPLAKLRAAVERDACTDPETFEPDARAIQIAALTDALDAFRKPGGHYVGCVADKTGGLCSAACRRAQLALDPGQAHHATHEIGRLIEAVRGLEADRASLRRQLRQRREYLRKVLRRAKAETGFELRPGGRPRSRETTPATTQ